jgi:hypothetical protein
MDEKHVVVVSRKFEKGAPIRVDVTKLGISISTPLDAFLDELVVEVGNPTFLFRQASLREALGKAAMRAVNNMKAETAAVM